MYQLHVTVKEYIGAIEVSGVLSDTNEVGHTQVIAEIHPKMWDRPSQNMDDVSALLVILSAWALQATNASRDHSRQK